MARRVAAREPEVLRVTLYPNGSMNVEYGNWRPIEIQVEVDPDARAFAEAFRVLVVGLMRKRLRVPL